MHANVFNQNSQGGARLITPLLFHNHMPIEELSSPVQGKPRDHDETYEAKHGGTRTCCA